ncbi:hypothetical protein [Streptomonospora litoralis]|uniref:Uncharacterized protein n=1 Tax=Streptomonospora litoralis TaxID=2498135 RepID=A0A4P6Q797_9ACTN|nr:hypothetical protein [Streptomonospora litoralis]QBI55311.1 hypothetical protein EKD16_17715 [Streptomonospora litoralis]
MHDESDDLHGSPTGASGGLDRSRDHEHDRKWFVLPAIGTVLTLGAAPVVFFILAWTGAVIQDQCGSGCTSETALWYIAVSFGVAALLTAAGLWFGPRTYRWRRVRTGAAAIMAGMGLLSVVLAFASPDA